MKRYLCFIFLIIFPFFSVFGQRIVKEKITTSEKQKIIMNLNYIQYSTVQISEYMNKSVADSEFNFILNRINAESLIDSQVIKAYTDLLETMATIRLKEDEKDFMNQMAEKQRKMAFTNVFNSFGSVFVPGATPKQMIASLAYAGTAAAFNYMSTVSNINNSNQQALFQISQAEKEKILDAKTKLFSNAKTMAQRYGLNDYSIIEGNSMLDFIRTVKKSPTERASALENKTFKTTFEYFPPYWFELGCAFQEIGDYEKAKTYYDYFESLLNNRVIKNDSYYIQLAKNYIKIYLGNSPNPLDIEKNAKRNRSIIEKYLKIIESETPAEIRELAKNNHFMAQIYFLLENYEKSLELLDWNINNKTGAPEYIDESINLVHLIKASLNTGDDKYYRIAENYSQIPFGNDTESVEKVFEQIDYEYGFFKSVQDKAPDMLKDKVPFTSKDYESCFNAIKGNNSENVVNKENLYWSMPENMIKTKKLLVVIDNVSYIPEIVYPKDSYKEKYSPVCFINYKISNIKMPFYFTINVADSDLDLNEELILTYFIQPVTDKEIQISEKALNRIGSDISTKNINIILGLASALKNYKYSVSDIDKEKKTVTDKIKKEYKKDGLTELQLEDLVNEEMVKVLESDNKKLNALLAQVESDHYQDYQYKSKSYKEIYTEPQPTPYSSSIYYFDKKIIASSLVSLTSKSLGYKEATFDSVGRIVKTDAIIPENSLKDIDMKNLYKSSIRGDTKSQFELGRRYYEGINVSNNYTLAVKWLYRAASKNHGEACKYMGICYLNGNGVLKDKDIAKNWFILANKNGIVIDEKYLK